MTRVAVIGNAGGGKSTLCRLISERLNLPYYPVDLMQWRPGWQATPQVEFDRLHDGVLAKNRWILDGYGDWDSIERRFAAADTIIFVDHPLWRHYWWAGKRQVRALFFGRPDGPEGCPMPGVTLRLFRMIWWLHHEMRPRLQLRIQAHAKDTRIIHLRSPQDLKAFAADPENY